MYVEINAVYYFEEKKCVVIDATDLDTLLLNDWDQIIAEMEAEKRFKFDLTQQGHRIYLYKIVKSNNKEMGASLVEMLNNLVGKTMTISNNFLECTLNPRTKKTGKQTNKK